MGKPAEKPCEKGDLTKKHVDLVGFIADSR